MPGWEMECGSLFRWPRKWKRHPDHDTTLCFSASGEDTASQAMTPAAMLSITCSILCHNYGRYLAQAIDSCLGQLPGNYQSDILVIDDGSTDDTPAVCARYGSKIRVVQSRNEGFPSALTKAIRLADGDYVCLLDADDFFAPHKLATIAQQLGGGGRLLYNGQLDVNEDGLHLNRPAREGGCTSTITVHWETALSVLPVENELFLDSIRASGCFVQITEPLTYYRHHKGSMSKCQMPGKWASELAKVSHQLADRLLLGSRLPWIRNRSVQRAWGRLYRSRAYYHELEAALECSKPLAAFRACGHMLWAAAGSIEGVSMFHAKMMAKTMLLRPSFPKKP